MRHRVALAAVVATILLLLASAGVAAGYATAPGYVAHDYVTGFRESAVNHWGPLGIAFDQSDNLYVADTVDGNIYRFQPGGGVASPATRLTSSPIPGTITGLAVSRSGELYLGRYKSGDVVQVDPASGQILRTIASISCATGLAIDPISGDLFVSQNLCGNTIWRVSLSGSSVGTVTPYASAPAVDGMAFDKDGDLYAGSGGTLMKIDGTARPTPGLVKSIAKIPWADGVAFGAHASGSPPFVVTNRNDGIVTRVDLTKTPPTKSDIFVGGSRGDFAAVDSAGCLFITQSSSIVRISGTKDSCTFEPTTPGTTPPGVAVTVLGSPPTSCTGIRSLTFRIRRRGRVRLRSAKIYINGKVVRKLHGRALTAPITLRHLPRSSFILRVVVTTKRGRKLRSARHFYVYCGCTNTRRLTLRVPRHGSRTVRVVAYVNGHRVKAVRGHSIRRIVLKGLPAGRFTVKLVVVNAHGRRKTTRRTFVGCSGKT